MITTDRGAAWGFLKRYAPGVPYSEDFRGISDIDVKCGQVRAAVGYTGFNEVMCLMHVAVDPGYSISKALHRAILAYPFKQLGLKYALAVVEQENVKACRFAERMGFRKVFVMENATATGAPVVFYRADGGMQ
jgi:RimJ/RimL family protein N-acetyltransferase